MEKDKNRLKNDLQFLDKDLIFKNKKDRFYTLKNI